MNIRFHAAYLAVQDMADKLKIKAGNLASAMRLDSDSFLHALFDKDVKQVEETIMGFKEACDLLAEARPLTSDDRSSKIKTHDENAQGDHHDRGPDDADWCRAQ